MIRERIYAEIVTRSPLPNLLVYQVPIEMKVETGTRVIVPLGSRKVEGVVMRLHSSLDEALSAQALWGQGSLRSIKPIAQVLAEPLLSSDLVKLLAFIPKYYMVTPGAALSLILPSYKQAKVQDQVRLSDHGKAIAKTMTTEIFSQTTASLAIPLTEIEEDVLVQLYHKKGRAVSRKALKENRPKNASPAEVEHALRALEARGLLTIEDGVKERSPTHEFLQASEPNGASMNQSVDAGEVGADPQTLPPSVPFQKEQVLLNDKRVLLNDEQERAVSVLKEALSEKGGVRQHKAFLLSGVTGSGKTEVYMHAIEAALALHKTALVLVPEIALTPQLAERFQRRFPGKVGVIHSGLSLSERKKAWQRFQSGEHSIALGPRSALFVPLERLGVIVVDEEHDSSFKQQEDVFYQGRDLALLRGQYAGALVILGSATPSLESIAMVESGKLTQLRLTRRSNQAPMPEVRVIDLKKYLASVDEGLMSAPLLQAIEENLQKQEQTLLFLNRRGYSTFVSCMDCGHRFECVGCSVGLVWHQATGRLMCHHCDYQIPLPKQCGTCQGKRILRLGVGTQKIVEFLQTRFPKARIVRLDRDSTTPKMMSETILQMQSRTIDILVGTQMLAKGHDFSGVTLVGVVLADVGMHAPDFRAFERTFQTLTQVAGRAGRAEKPGQVLIQTFLPDHPAVRWACTQDIGQFTKDELQVRKAGFYPPYSRMAAIRLDGIELHQVRERAQEAARLLNQEIERHGFLGKAKVLGPSPAPISRLKGKIRYQCFLQAETSKMLHILLQGLSEKSLVEKQVRLHIDVDPVSML